MQMDDMVLVSIDDHSIEPPDMYEKSRTGKVEKPHVGWPRAEWRKRNEAAGIGLL